MNSHTMRLIPLIIQLSSWCSLDVNGNIWSEKSDNRGCVGTLFDINSLNPDTVDSIIYAMKIYGFIGITEWYHKPQLPVPVTIVLE